MRAHRSLLLPIVLLAAGWLPAPAFAGDRRTAELELAQAATAVQGAERADAIRWAGADIEAAHAELAAAQQAFDHDDWTRSAMAAEKAKVDGDLAAARSRQQRATAATREIEDSVRELRARLGLPPGETP